MSRPTIEDVARAAGVSRSTASRVINDEPGASEPMRARVQSAILALGYQPNLAARALASGRPRVVDLVAVTAGPPCDGWFGVDPYYSRVLAGIMPVLESAGAQMRLHAVSAESAARTLDELADAASLGVLLIECSSDLAVRLPRRSLRVVSIVPTAAEVPSAEADNAGGAEAAVEHLYALGRRRIGAIHGPVGNTCADERRAGWRRAVERLELADVSVDADFHQAVGYEAATRLLQEHPDLDALFVACDMTAAGAIQAITAGGRRVPEDVSVVGFDDSIAAVCTNPPLTTVRVPVEEMAAAAARMLIEGAPPDQGRRRFPVELVVRTSAAKP